jgi:hypothetical protein
MTPCGKRKACFPLPRLDKTQNVPDYFKPKLTLSRAVQLCVAMLSVA